MAEMKTLTINGEQFTLPFAPSGYGLGTVAATAPDRNPDNITATGFYRCEIPELMGNTAWWVGYHACTYNDNSYAVQEFTYHGAYITCKVRRDRIDGKWQPWEWVNPPMTLGVEYRTTERYLGSVVYTKAIDAGYLPNSVMKQVSFTDDTSVTPFAWYGSASNGTNKISIPYQDNVKVGGLDNKLVINTTADYSAYSAKIAVKYIKG